MPIRPTSIAHGAELEIDGKAAGVLQNVKLPGIAVEQVVQGEERLVGTVRPTEMQVAFEPAGSGALFDWVRQALHGKQAEYSGAVTLTGASGKPIRRVDWAEGLLQELRMPTLDVEAAKAPFTLGLSWLPKRVVHADPRVRIPAAFDRRPGVLSSNFRVTGLPIKTRSLRRVVLPAVKFRRADQAVGSFRLETQVAEVQIGDVQFDFAVAAARELFEWALKVNEGGRVSQDQVMDIGIELLDTRMDKVLVTIGLSGCMLRGYEEAPLLGGSAANSTVSLRFSVGSLDLTA